MKRINYFCFSLILFFSLWLVASGTSCNSTGNDKTATNINPPVNTPAASTPATTTTEETAPPDFDETFLDRIKREKWNGDVKGMLERRYIRALVFYNKTNFFFDGAQPRGVTYEVLKEFEKLLNKKLNTGKKPIHIVFIPTTRSEAFNRMSDGRGDIVAGANLAIVPELQNIGDFSDPLRTDAVDVVVTGPTAPPITTLDDLAGKEVFVRKLSRYWLNLEQLNAQFKRDGKPQIILKEADANLEDEDILNLVHSGAVGITVTDDLIAGLWAKIYENLKVRNDLKVATDEQIGWLVQKGTPEFLALVNEFVRDNKIGTTFGNVLLQKYLKEVKWASNNVTHAELEKVKAAAPYFRKYGNEYNFDLLMIAAQAYQESTIDQSRRSQVGAVGVMQIKPSTAADRTVGINDVENSMDNNIHAGVKYMDYILRANLKDAKLDKTNRTLFALAAYNAGPARIAKLRKRAEAEGYNPNVWFNNVEIIAAREIGAETVTYVSNIYKYYVGYKMFADFILPQKIKHRQDVNQ
jgi:membrane-bound lytic murein transglycosylase MltF